MKNFKYVLYAFIFALVMFAPLSMVGCAKHYEFSLSINNSEWGTIKSVGSGTSLASDIEVQEGTDFEFAVSPNSHYKVVSVKINNEEVYNINASTNKYTPDSAGIIRPCIFDVDSDYSIEVEFGKIEYSITFYYANPDQTSAQSWLELDYKVSKAFDEEIYIDGISDFGFTYTYVDPDTDQTTQSTFAPVNDRFTISKNWELYTTKTEAELKALLNITNQ